MAGGKGLSWKWKLTIAFVALSIFLLILAFTPWGCQVMRNGLERAYENCPAEERREHWSANWWMRLAFWEGFICGRRQVSQRMYLEFIGIAPKGDTFFQDTYLQQGQKKWDGKFYDPKTKTGWGVLHPRAPEAYWNYLCLEESFTSGQQIHKLASFYPTLFWTIYGQETRGNSPHPKLYVYWGKTRIPRMLQLKFGGWTQPPPRPASCDPPEDE
jgi:hypothetical protein